jgi:hypothetical protein
MAFRAGQSLRLAGALDDVTPRRPFFAAARDVQLLGMVEQEQAAEFRKHRPHTSLDGLASGQFLGSLKSQQKSKHIFFLLESLPEIR